MRKGGLVLLAVLTLFCATAALNPNIFSGSVLLKDNMSFFLGTDQDGAISYNSNTDSIDFKRDGTKTISFDDVSATPAISFWTWLNFMAGTKKITSTGGNIDVELSDNTNTDNQAEIRIANPDTGDVDAGVDVSVEGWISANTNNGESLPSGPGLHIGANSGTGAIFEGDAENPGELAFLGSQISVSGGIKHDSGNILVSDGETIGTENHPSLLTLNDASGVTAYSSVYIGADDTRQGVVSVFGGAIGGGQLWLNNGAATDTHTEGWYVKASDDFAIADSTKDRFTIDSETGNLTIDQDLQVNGGNIGISTDTDLIQVASGTVTINGDLEVTGDYPSGGGGGLDEDGNLVMEDGSVIKTDAGLTIAKMYSGEGNIGGGMFFPETVILGGGFADSAVQRSGHIAVIGEDDGNVPPSLDFWNSDADDNGSINTWTLYSRGTARFIGMTSLGNDKTVWEANEYDRSMSTHNGLTLTHDSAGQTAYAVMRVGQSPSEGEEWLVGDGQVSLSGNKSFYAFATGFPSGCIPTSVQTTVSTAITGGGDAHHYTVGYADDHDAYGTSSGLTVDTKTDCILIPEVLSASRNPHVYVVNSGGSECSDNCTNGSVRLTIRYRAMNSLDDQLPALTFSPVAGTYTGSQSVTITSSISGTIIRYTTNGSTPTQLSPVYTGAITVDSSKTIKAKGFKYGYTHTYTSAAYVIN